ncbi:MAG: aspartate dehydrogenase [Lachnospiraceae bacterium]|nr:aspartate dehydrogenase [Lachnospiraceae bacterium]MBO5145662.1 aspartate dehydrogenase [Lachnospiraceae bacterium]
MLAARQVVSERVNILNKKPMIRKNQSTGEMVAGFLDPESGAFEVAMEISDERDIDEFLEEYDLSVVMISKM